MATTHDWSKAVTDGWPLLELLEDGVATVLHTGAVARCNGAFRQLVGDERVGSPELAAALLAHCQAGEMVSGTWVEVTHSAPDLLPPSLRRLTIVIEAGAEPSGPRWILVVKDTSNDAVAAKLLASADAVIHQKFREMVVGERAAKRNLQRLAGAVAILLAIFGLVSARAYYVVYRKYDLPLPPVVRSPSKDALARGEKIFTSGCSGCHVANANLRMMAPQLRGLATMASPNITSDLVSGVGNWRDEELARSIRYSVRRDGQPLIGMPAFDLMGDSDLAAVISFMRSEHEFFAPDPQVRPRPTLTFAGVLTMAYRVGVNTDVVMGPVPVPPKGATVEYGAYMANAVYRCWDCHTEGMSRDRRTQQGAFGGGFEFLDDEGRPIYSVNLTFHDAGLGKWSLVEFTRAVRDGVGPSGFIVQPPMQRFRAADNEELEGMYKFLQTLPKVEKANRIGGAPKNRPAKTATPQELYAQLGCRLCHGWKAPFDARLRQSAGKPVSWVATWIRNPQQFKADTQMPTFADLVDESQALVLADWLQKATQINQPKE